MGASLLRTETFRRTESRKCLALSGQTLAQNPVAPLATQGSLRRSEVSGPTPTAWFPHLDKTSNRQNGVNNFYEKLACNPENICAGRAQRRRRLRKGEGLRAFNPLRCVSKSGVALRLPPHSKT